MEVTGKILDLTQDYQTNKFRITFEVNEAATIKSEYDKLKDIDKLAIKVDKYRKKRSLDANSYFHVLVGKIADVHNISKAYCKNILISKYGQIEFVDTEMVVIKTNIPPEQMLEQETLHCLPCGVKVENGKEVNFYRVYRGSHSYDSREMSLLIDGTVEEAKALGIETVTDEEIRKMKERWNVKIEKTV